MFTRDKDDDEAYVECPGCGAMAMSVGESTDALARHFSADHEVGGPQDSTAEAPVEDEAENSDGDHRPEPGLIDEVAGGAGIFAGLLTVPEKPEPEAGPPPVAGGFDFGLDDELGDFHLPAATTPGNPALSPQKKTVGAKKSTTPAAPRPPRPPVEQPLADVQISLGDDALDALGAAFDSMAARPSTQRGADGLSDDERNFLSAEMPKKVEPATPPRRPPPRPPGKPGERRQPPPPRAKKRGPGDRTTSTGIALSAEAREAAFLPLKPVAVHPASAQAADTAIRPRARRVVDNEATVVAVAPAESTQLVTRPTKVAPREKPSVMAGLSKLAMAAAVLCGLVGGTAVGAATAPTAIRRNDARGRAEQQVAEGNRFYREGRFDDAIAAYKAALTLDRAYAVAHRAKGAALANKQRYDEAAEAYRDYLALEPQAIDAVDIKEALSRRGVSPVGGGIGGR